MSLFGKLEDTPLEELLQVVSASRITGKLRLTGRDREGILVFRDGKIVYAASSGARQTLGNLLLMRQLLTEEQLSAALDRQHAAREEQRLGNILIDMDLIDESVLAEVVRHQTERVVAEFVRWQSGYFKLDKLELENFGEVEVDAREFLMREGLSTDSFLTDLQEQIEALPATAENVASAAESAGGTSSGGSRRNLSTLKSLMGEIRSPQFTGEITQKILSYAHELCGRGVLFVDRQDGFGVMGQFGVDSERGQSEARLRQLIIPDDQPSILSEVAGRKEAMVGPLEDNEWNRKMLDAIGGPTAGDSVAAPMIVNDRVLLILYGDRLQEDLREGWLDELELLILQAGLAMEKDLLEKRIAHYENLRRQH